MLQVIRNRAQGVVAWTIVILIAVIFALLGLNEFFTARNSSSVAAKVNGNKIYWSTINNIYQSVYKQYAAHPDFNLDDLNPVIVKKQILDSLIKQTALLNHLQKEGYRVSKEQLIAVLQNVPAFNKDGKFSANLYHSVLQSNGLTDRAYQNNLRKDILINQVQQAIGSSSFSTQAETKEIINLLNQKRDFGYALLSKAKFAKNVIVSPEEILSFYNEHKQDFMSLKKVKVAYVELGLNDVIKGIEVNEAALKQYYNDNVGAYSSKASVRVSHILINAPKASATEEELKKARAKAEELLAKIKADNKAFDNIAKQYSEDRFSATHGGDLGWLRQGGNVDPEIEKAAFSLAVNEISNIIQTDFGFHIIKVTEQKSQNIRPFDAVQDEVKNQYIKEQAEKILVDKAEEFANLAFEYPGDLETVAKSMGLELKESEVFAQDGTKTGIGSVKKVVDAAFSDDLLGQDKNSDLIKISDDNFVVIKVKEIIPSKQLELSEAENKIKELLINSKTKKILDEESAKIVAALKDANANTNTNTNSIEDVIKQYNLEWKNIDLAARGYDKVSNQIMQQVFSLPKPQDNKVSATDVKMDNGDYAVIVLKRIHNGKLELENQNTAEGESSAAKNAGNNKVVEDKIDTEERILNSSTNPDDTVKVDQKAQDADKKLKDNEEKNSAKDRELKELAMAYGRHIEVTMGRYEYNLYEDSIYKNVKVKINELPN